MNDLCPRLCNKNSRALQKSLRCDDREKLPETTKFHFFQAGHALSNIRRKIYRPSRQVILLLPLLQLILRRPALWNPVSEPTQEHYCGTTETLPSGSIVHRPTSEEFRPYGLDQVIYTAPSVNTVRYVRL